MTLTISIPGAATVYRRFYFTGERQFGVEINAGWRGYREVAPGMQSIKATGVWACKCARVRSGEPYYGDRAL